MVLGQKSEQGSGDGLRGFDPFCFVFILVCLKSGAGAC